MSDQGSSMYVAGSSDSGVSDTSWTNSSIVSNVSSVSSAASDATITASPASSVDHPQQTPGVDQIQHGPQEASGSLDSGISSMRSGQDQSLPQQHAVAGNRTQEWINNSQFNVFVKTLNGDTLTVQTNADETVASFKAKVDEATGVVGSQQRLTTLEGRDLKDRDRLRDYNIGRDSTLRCLGRLRGGYI
ncbi:unnamed protein product [Lymnaea stagnalis]|uniref:Ubiquitin-like domain-containing protein n=1 Tax=Lymnaea stagnalis TaxID=6523 RepID=A0AAV2IGN8_LYMST